MRSPSSILGPVGEQLLDRLAACRVVLAFAYDGALAPIADHPDATGMRAPTRRLLEALACRYPCVVIGARPRAELHERLASVDPVLVLGCSGRRGAGRRRQVQSWLTVLRTTIGDNAGIDVQDHGLWLAVHHDRTSRAESLILDIAARLRGARVALAPAQVRVLPADAPRPGASLLALCRESRADSLVHLGDDLADEDLFPLRRVSSLLQICVAPHRPTRAQFCLGAQGEVDDLLEGLVGRRLRRRGGVT
jgi:trehalose-phosphatase